MTTENAMQVAVEVLRERFEAMSPREVGTFEYNRMAQAVQALEEELEEES